MPVKDWEEGDEQLWVDPERDCATRVFLYKRYVRVQDKACPVRCACFYYGASLCPMCEGLNTSVFYGMGVPLNPGDWGGLRAVMTGTHLWSDRQLYGWLGFWVKSVGLRHSHKRLVFFEHEPFDRLSTHGFFQYLYDFVVVRKVPPARVPRDHHRVVGDRVLVSTLDAAIRASFMIYGPMRSRVTGTTSDRNRCSSFYFSDVPDPRNDCFAVARWHLHRQEKNQWRRVFDAVVREIEEEVRFRPGMCGMRECQDSFSAQARSLLRC